MVAIASFALAGCLSRPLSLDQPPRETRLAAERIEPPAVFSYGRPYVELRVNGKGPYRFLVDTGAEGTSITRQVAREAGISSSRHYVAAVHGSSGQSERQSMGIVDRMASPGLSLEAITVTILTPESAALLVSGDDLSNGGIIGMSAFRDVRLEIDYPGKKIGLVRLDPETLPAGAGVPYTGNLPHVTITTPSSRHATTTALIDTGSDSGFGLTDIASYPLRVGLAKVDDYTRGIGGYWRPLFGQLAGDIRLGTATWRNPRIHSAGGNRIGSEALASWKLVVDQRRKMLWLLEADQVNTTTWTGPLEADGRPSVYGFAFVPDGDSFVIKEVDPGSRAERAGLKIGDRILPQSADASALDHARKNDPYLAKLRIARGEERFEITMTLSEPIRAR